MVDNQEQAIMIPHFSEEPSKFAEVYDSSCFFIPAEIIISGKEIAW
jgi:hypothetical protein